ncbi:MAG: ATP-grasp fold amidoligase family protein [Steroidobacteraceae bacterium]
MLRAIARKYLPRLVRDLIIGIRMHRAAHGEYPRLLLPRTFNERVLRRKVFDRRPILAQFADKCAVRQYVAQRLTSDILPKVYCVTDNPAAIPFARLPQRFVVKPTHGSGWVRVVLDKEALDVEELINACNQWLATNYYDFMHEQQYRRIPRRIMVEEFIDDGSGSAPTDYKFYVFHGNVHMIQIDGSRFTRHQCALYDRHWRDTGVGVQLDRFSNPVREPVNLRLMLETAEELGAGMDFVRVDLYDIGTRIYFGEMTGTPGAGLARFQPPEMDEYLGQLWRRRPVRAWVDCLPESLPLDFR